MAAEIEKPTQFGVPATFWRINNLEIHRSPEVVRVCVNGYLSQAAFRSGAAAIASYEYVWPQTQMPFAVNDLAETDPLYQFLSILYAEFMQHDFFAGARQI